MVNVLCHTKLLLLLCYLTDLGIASPAALSRPSIQETGTGASSHFPQRDALTATAATPIPSTRENSIPHRTQSGDVYALDPFGFLGGNQPEETQNRGSSTSSPTSATSKADFSTEKHDSTASSTASTDMATTTSNKILGTPGQDTIEPSWTSMASTQTSGNNATPTDQLTPKQTAGSTSQASSGMNSWKIIGIGIVTFVGILTLILGFTFHDTWWKRLLRPVILGKRNKNDGLGEELIPDWKRRSWRFGIEEKEGADRYPDDSNMLKVNFSQGLYSNSTLVNGDKFDEKSRDVSTNNLAFPLPPVPPFPLRRAPSMKSNPGTEPYTIPNDQENSQNNTSIVPSPPPVHAPNRNSLNAIGLPSVFQYSQEATTNESGSTIPSNKRKSRASLRVSRSDFGCTNSIYGGIA